MLPRWRLKSSAEGDTELFFFFFAERKPWLPALAAISRRKRSRHLLLDASLSADTAVTPAQSCHLGTVRAVHLRHMFGFPILKTVIWTTVLCSWLYSRRNAAFCCCDLGKFSRLPFQLFLYQSGDGEQNYTAACLGFFLRGVSKTRVFSRSICSLPPSSAHIRNYQGG